ncbi:MAG: lipid carrier, partial [Aquamicrobium sp.]|nr:lipid carrier [Aquamicrobium sp.]
TPADLIGLSGTLGRLADAGILGTLDVARRFALASAPEAAERRS